jgi:tRNA threonylcarbamoyladenosine modification (KEOPS) complex Cgi121 subunit
MLIERVLYREEVLFVGIGELSNESMKKKDELISLSTALTDETTVVQFLSPILIAGPIHLLSAAQNAINAIKGKYAISRSLNVEIIVYASAQRQIEVAFEKVGVEDDLKTVGVVIIDERKDAIQECFEQLFIKLGSDIEPAFSYDRKRMNQIMKSFDVSDTELRTFTDSDKLDELQDALIRCIVSRVSMVALDA